MSTGTVKPGQRLIRAAKPHGVQRIEPPAQRGSTYGTAVYGPVHTVVWEGRTGDRSPYPDSDNVAQRGKPQSKVNLPTQRKE